MAIGAIFFAVVGSLIPILTNSIYEQGYRLYIKDKPVTYFFKYHSIDPIPHEPVINNEIKIKIGEPLWFKSDAEFFVETNIEWVDRLKCDGGDNDGDFSPFSTAIDKDLNKPPQRRMTREEYKEYKGWRYNADLPSSSRYCILESTITHLDEKTGLTFRQINVSDTFHFIP